VLILAVLYVSDIVEGTQESNKSDIASEFFVEIFVVYGAFNKVNACFPTTVQFVILEIGIEPMVHFTVKISNRLGYLKSGRIVIYINQGFDTGFVCCAL
jgi:hypothetical protein